MGVTVSNDAQAKKQCEELGGVDVNGGLVNFSEVWNGH
jgi:hypothetical protein